MEEALWLARVAILWAEEGGVRLADDLVGRVSLDALGARVPGGDPTIGVQDEYRVVVHAFDEQAQELVAGRRRRGGSPLARIAPACLERIEHRVIEGIAHDLLGANDVRGERGVGRVLAQ